MLKIDCKANEYVASALPLVYEWIIAAKADCEEDYTVRDVVFSAITEDNNVLGFDLENKRIMGGWQLKYNNQWNPYFTSEIYNKLRFESHVESGHPIYFVNATDAYGNFENGKWKKLLDSHACLCYLAPDGLLLFSPKALKEAFIGYADYYVKHTTQFNNKKMLWEKKAVISLEKGAYVPLNPPLYLFEK